MYLYSRPRYVLYFVVEYPYAEVCQPIEHQRRNMCATGYTASVDTPDTFVQSLSYDTISVNCIGMPKAKDRQDCNWY